MNLKGRKDEYCVIGDKVAETETYRLYLCEQVATGRECFLQIALSAAGNAALDRMAYFLDELQARAEELEVEYATVRTDPKKVLNYGFQFPELLDSFVSSEQGGRKVNILAYRCVDAINAMVPIQTIMSKDSKGVDLRTSAWILGKLLKLLTFAHSQHISIGRLDESNVFIEPDKHYVLVFDWSGARIEQGGVSADVARQEIMAVARLVITFLDGDHQKRFVPEQSMDDGFALYTQHLFQLAAGSSASAEDAHAAFYKLIGSQGLKWKGKHPFTPVNVSNKKGE